MNHTSPLSFRLRPLPLLVALAAFSQTTPLLAQTPPDAGRVLNEMRQPAQPTLRSTTMTIDEQSLEPTAEPGGPQVEISEIHFEGNSLFTQEQLLAVINDAVGESQDMAGLQRLSQRITDFYHQQDYPFSLAYLPPQTLKSGKLVIGVVEGRYGEIRFNGSDELAQSMAARLPELQAGDPIQGNSLNRAINLLGDLPGVSIDPVLMPGQTTGTGDLAIAVKAEEKVSGSLGVDNHGNRYTGSWRTLATASVNRLATVGDRLDLALMATEEELWYGNLGYSLPIANTGARGYLRYTQTYYQLGEEFEDLGATGKARIGTLGVEYPLIRSQNTNLYLDLGYSYNHLQDKPASPFFSNKKSSESVTASLRFDHRDGFFGGGLTWSDFSFTSGDLDLDETLAFVDRMTAETEGQYSKLNLELARLQRLNDQWTLYGRINGQWTDDNLDSSEGMGLGGANGVRAYPEGEAFGDRGWLAQLELRYQYEQLQPYLFYDAGAIELNTRPWAEGDNHRKLAGAGLGLRASLKDWQFNLTSAWRLEGGQPESDTEDRNPRVWASVNYRF